MIRRVRDAKRVVVTGMGCVTPLGTSASEVWDALLSGKSGVGPLKACDPSGLPVKIAAEVRDWNLACADLSPRDLQRMSRQTQFALGAADEAMRQAGVAELIVEQQFDPRRLGVYLGCGEVFPNFHQFVTMVQEASARVDFSLEAFMDQGLRALDPDEQRRLEPSAATAELAAYFNAQGPHANCIAACASGNQAIGEAAEKIRDGDADVMLAGAAHSMIHPFGISGFHRLGTLSNWQGDPGRAMRPFDRERNGFVVGEGAAVLVLEDLDHALRRGAEVLAEIAGFGAAQDAYRVTDIHPEGRGARLCMQRALQAARLDPSDIGYINAHGTSTPLNDVIETAAIKRVFGQHAYRTWISSTKSMMGHLTTAGGAIEAAVCVMSLRNRTVHPTLNYEHPDPGCDLDYVPNIARELPALEHAMTNSLGFGGQNVSLIVSAYHG